jgi:putative ATP-dependent endonuclease of OLD family
MSIKLKSLRLRNFRIYSDTTINFDKKMNVIIGKNDVGKSTILEALEIFFNNEQVKIDPDDLNIKCKEDKKVIMNCSFEIDESTRMIIDATNPTKLTEEYLLNESGDLEIQKEWNCEKGKIGASDIKTYIVAKYPKISSKPLVCEKITELKKILESVNPERYKTVDKTKSSEIRKAIYECTINSSTIFELTLIDASLEDAKNIWASLRVHLPLYFLFKSDRENSDKDSEVQSPMKAATKIVLASMRSQLDELCENVKKEVEKIGFETIEKLRELNYDIAQLLTPKLTLKPFDSVFSFDLLSDDGIPLNKRGSGIRRLILLSYFRAEAEKRIKDSHNNSVIYAIEEPETSQHPDYQRMIVETLQQISNNENHQIIITTHTPEIAKMVDLNQLIFIARDVFGFVCIEDENERKYSSIVSSLGILPFAVSQVVICVEGENDVNFISNINESIPEFKSIISLKGRNIKVVPMYGSNLVRWVNENYFKESNIKEIHLYDNDRKDYIEIISKIQQERDGRRYGWNTQRREMENYIPPILIEELFDIDLGQYKKAWETVDVITILKNIALKKIEDQKKREQIIKSMLNGKLTKKANAEMLRDIGVFNELETFFKRVRAIADGAKDEKLYEKIN